MKMKYVKELNENYKVGVSTVNVDDFKFVTKITNIKQIYISGQDHFKEFKNLDKNIYSVNDSSIISCDIVINHELSFNLREDGIYGIEYVIYKITGDVTVDVYNNETDKYDDFTINLNDIKFEYDSSELKIGSNGQYVIDEIEIDFENNTITLKNNFNED